jgi:hypothetical protein
MGNTASDRFKLVLMNMKQEDVLNFIWLYDQYVCKMNELREEEEDWNIFTLNIEDFYHQVYKSEFKVKK